MSTMNKDAKMLRDRFGIAYTVALSLVRRLGAEAALAHLAARYPADFVQDGCARPPAGTPRLDEIPPTAPTMHDLWRAQNPAAALCLPARHRLTYSNERIYGDDPIPTVVHGVCCVCHTVVDRLSFEDYRDGPRTIVDLTAGMVRALRDDCADVDSLHARIRAHIVHESLHTQPADRDPNDTRARLTGRRHELELFAEAFRSLARRRNAPVATLAQHAAHRIEAALAGARR